MIGVMSPKIVEVTDYWPEGLADLSRVVWSHATNSHQVRPSLTTQV